MQTLLNKVVKQTQNLILVRSESLSSCAVYGIFIKKFVILWQYDFFLIEEIQMVKGFL